MNCDLEDYMEAEGLSDGERELLREQSKHSVSCYSLMGERIETLFDREDLLALISQMERYIIDSNVPWKSEVSQPKNSLRAFIIGHTVADEKENLKDVLFGVDNSNNSVFSFGFDFRPRVPRAIIERYDEYSPKIFDEVKLREDSRPRKNRTDSTSIAQEQKHLAEVAQAKIGILNILRLPHVVALPHKNATERMKALLIQRIRANADASFKNYWMSVNVAMDCYAALLLERDIIGQKTRDEFNDSQRRNVLGDTRLIQNALWLNSGIFSNDNAVRRMAEYIDLPDIKVVGCF